MLETTLLLVPLLNEIYLIRNLMTATPLLRALDIRRGYLGGDWGGDRIKSEYRVRFRTEA